MASRRDTERNERTNERSQASGSASSTSGTSSGSKESRESKESKESKESRESSASAAKGGRTTQQSTTSDREQPIPRSGEGVQLQTQGQGGLPGFLSRGMPITPWDLVRRMGEELEQLVQTVDPAAALASRRQGLTKRTGGRTARSDGGNGATALLVPQIEVEQRDDALIVRADLPGTKADEVEVIVDEGVLVIRGERKEEHREEREGFIRSEVQYGTFLRTLPLPDGVDEDRIKANVRDGVLEIVIPVANQGKGRGRRISVGT